MAPSRSSESFERKWRMTQSAATLGASEGCVLTTSLMMGRKGEGEAGFGLSGSGRVSSGDSATASLIAFRSVDIALASILSPLCLPSPTPEIRTVHAYFAARIFYSELTPTTRKQRKKGEVYRLWTRGFANVVGYGILAVQIV
eukprot:353395-Rhodomonas_salina.4